MNIEITYIPECGKIVLTKDKNLTPEAVKYNSIELEHSLANLPEVKALTSMDRVWDVGAFVGDTALIFGRYAGSVIGFEPQTDAWLCAVWNTRNSDGIEIVNAAVGNGEQVQLRENPLAGNLGTRSLGVGEGVSTLKLDDYWAEPHPTFLKIDVEGFEPNVIAGALKMIAASHPQILVEVYDPMLAQYGFTRKDVIDPLLALGYTYRCAIGREEDERCDLLFTFDKAIDQIDRSALLKKLRGKLEDYELEHFVTDPETGVSEGGSACENYRSYLEETIEAIEFFPPIST